MSDARTFRPICRPAFDQTEFYETVDVMTHTFKNFLEKDPVKKKKDVIVLYLLQLLKKNSKEMPKNISGRFESWMKRDISSFSLEQVITNNLSSDVCVAVISWFEFEDRFMEVLLQEREFEIIEEIADSLGRWPCLGKSAVFAIKCLEELLKTFEISLKKVEELQSLFLVKVDVILENLSYQEQTVFLKRLKRLYTVELFRSSSSLASNVNTKPLLLLKSAFELVRNEAYMYLKSHLRDEKAGLLDREISSNLENISLMQGNRKTEVLEFVCKDNSKILKAVNSNHDRVEIFKAGVLFMENMEAKLRCKVQGKYKTSKEADIDILWAQIVNLLVAGNLDDFPELTSSLLHLHNLQIMLRFHKFLELLDGWDNSTLSVVENLPDIAKHFGPVICSAEFLTNMFNDLANLHDEAVLDEEKQDIFDQLLTLVYDISKSAEIGVISRVMNSCIDAFNCETLDLFDSQRCKERFSDKLNLVMNQLSERDPENFHDVAHLSLISPFNTLHDLVSRACSSAPLSRLVLKFLDQMTPLLLLQKRGSQQKEIITIIINNLHIIEKEKVQVMADFMTGIMKIMHTHGCEAAVPPYDIISHVLIPGLENHRTSNSKGAPLKLLLLIFQSALDEIHNNGTKMNSNKMIDIILMSTFCMIEILAKYKAFDFAQFLSLHNERQQLHLTICSTLSKVKSLCLDKDIMKAMCEIILDKLPSMEWQHKFYMVDLLYDNSNSVQFPIPSPLFMFSSSFGNIKFHEIQVINSNQDPYPLWILVFKICEINRAIAQHFADRILRLSLPRTFDIIMAVAQSLVETTISGWKSVLILIRSICQTGNSHLPQELGLNGLESMPGVVKVFAYEHSVITHAFLIVLKCFLNGDEQVLLAAVQKIETRFINSVQELRDDDTYDGINCLAILYKFASLLHQSLPNSSQILDSVILQILETINRKELIKTKSDENEKWNERLLCFKKYIGNV